MALRKGKLTIKQEAKIKAFTINGKQVADEIWYESDFDEVSIWISLRDGFNFDGCSCVHEGSFREAMESLDCVSEGEPY
jgi:hypothetical protein